MQYGKMTSDLRPLAFVPSPTLAIILCTKDRPADLARCLASIARQTRPPDEVVIVDASEQTMGDERWTMADSDPSSTFNLQPSTFHSPPGLPRQRNLGLRHVQSDIVAFFDDDVELAPDYLAELLAVYERRADAGGVMGSCPEWRQSSGGAPRLKRLFGLTSVAATGEAVRVSKALGVGWVALPAREIPAEALVGFCMSFRRAAIEGMWFDENLGGYADGEDVDFSLRAGRKSSLWQTPNARLQHHKSRSGRATLRRRFFTRTRNEKYLHRKLLPRTVPYRLAWWWGAMGRILLALSVSLSQRSAGPLLGTIDGLHRNWNTDDAD
ncbi:MAG: glycosyltransferase family 2 protein [Caldilineales bacterium]|nr:glycosyltransferase family 2 protein [Caldilineales bacterium]